MKTPDNRETAQRILDTALALWSEKGYAESTMRELARRVGMGVSSLYFYFRSKEEIVRYLYATLNERARLRFLQEDRSGDAGAAFRRFLEIKLELLEPHRSSLAAILKEAVDPESSLSPMSRDSSGILGENLEFFKESILSRDGRTPAIEPEALARLMWIAHLAVLLYWLHDRSPGARNTHAVLEKLSGASSLLPMLTALPGAEDVLRLVTDLFHRPESIEASSAGPLETEGLPAREVDVVVIGAGPIGIVYSMFLKRARPRTRVLVLERSTEPGHKIGESTLSGFVKALQTLGIRKELMREIFYPKNGLGFLHLDETVADATRAPEYVLETFDETFQVERRVLDTLLIAQARKQGVQVIQGAKFDFKRSKLSAGGNVVVWQVGPATFRARASLVVDASGPASVIAHELGMRTDEGVPFQTSSVWTYYSGVKPLASHRGWQGHSQFPRDTYTEHFCFKEGWLWHIPIVSFQHAPTGNLGEAIDKLLRGGRTIPSRRELAEEFALPVQDIVSIGLSLRSDRDGRIKDDPRGALQHYAKKYPAIAGVLQGAKILDDHYGTGETFMSRLHYRGHARQIAGDGWMLVGDAAFFVDPLISPGLTGGTACAWHAAKATVKAFETNTFTRESFGEYESLGKQLHEALERDNEIVYMSFNHPEVLALVQRFQEIDARRHFLAHASSEYGDEDTNVWGILDPDYQKVQRRLWTVLREEEEAVGREVPIEEQSARDYERLVQRVRKLLGRYVDGHKDLTPYVKLNERREVARTV